MTLLKSLERKGWRVNLACLKNLAWRFSIFGALPELSFWIALWMMGGEKKFAMGGQEKRRDGLPLGTL